MSEDKSLNDLMDAFEERMQKRREAEAKKEADEAKRLAEAYQRRREAAAAAERVERPWLAVPRKGVK